MPLIRNPSTKRAFHSPLEPSPIP